MSDSGLSEFEAVEIAKPFLNANAPDRTPEVEISTTHVFDDLWTRWRRELREFCHQNGVHDESEIAGYLRGSMYAEEYWLVRFFHDDEPGTASTAPPTMVRVYDKDHRAEIAYAGW